MAKWNKIVITNAGYQLSAETLAGKNIRYTHAQTTDKDMSNLTSDQLKALTSLDSVVQDLSLGTVSVQDDHTVNVPVKVMNNDLQEDYLLYGFAIFAKIEGGEEVLYGIATSVNPDLIPAQNGSTVVGTTFKAKLHVGDASNVTIVISPDGSVSNEELEGILNSYVLTSDLDKLIAEKIPDTLTDSTEAEHITGTWNFDHANIGGYGIASTSYVDSKVSTIKIPDTLADTTQNEQITGAWNFPTKGTLKIGGVNVATLDDIGQQIDGTTLLHRDPDTGTVVESSNYNTGDLTVDNKNVATEDYVNGKVSSISVPDTLTDRTKNENITGAWDFTAITISSKHVATEPYVDSKVSSLASQDYVNTKVNGLASESYVNDKVTGLASEAFVNGKVSDATTTQNFNGDWNTLKSNGTYYSVSGTNLPPVSAYWLLRVTANHDGSRVEQMAYQDNGNTVWVRKLNGSWSSWTQLVDKDYVDSKVQGVLDQLTTKLTKLNFSYGNLTVDNDPVVPIVMVADEDTAKSQDTSKPHTQHEWSDE